MFKHHRYPKAIVLQAVYFKLRVTLSYRDVDVDYSTTISAKIHIEDYRF
jgi:transposase-like protein